MWMHRRGRAVEKLGYLFPSNERLLKLVRDAQARAVFAQMWRVLKDHGRAVVSDIVSEAAVPAAMRVNPRLWGECISGALQDERGRAAVKRHLILSAVSLLFLVEQSQRLKKTSPLWTVPQVTLAIEAQLDDSLPRSEKQRQLERVVRKINY